MCRDPRKYPLGVMGNPARTAEPGLPDTLSLDTKHPTPAPSSLEISNLTDITHADAAAAARIWDDENRRSRRDTSVPIAGRRVLGFLSPAAVSREPSEDAGATSTDGRRGWVEGTLGGKPLGTSVGRVVPNPRIPSSRHHGILNEVPNTCTIWPNGNV